MITFNNLTINDSKDKLSIECAIDSKYDGQDVWIRSIQLVYFDNLLSNGTIKDNEKAVSVFDDSEGALRVSSYSGEVVAEELEPCLPISPDLTFNKGLFYIVVTCDGADVPEHNIDYAVVPDWQFIYSIGMPFVARLSMSGIDRCDMPIGFEEFIILWFALRLAFDTFDITQIEFLWRKFLRFSGDGNMLAGGCPCNN